MDKKCEDCVYFLHSIVTAMSFNFETISSQISALQKSHEELSKALLNEVEQPRKKSKSNPSDQPALSDEFKSITERYNSSHPKVKNRSYHYVSKQFRKVAEDLFVGRNCLPWLLYDDEKGKLSCLICAIAGTEWEYERFHEKDRVRKHASSDKHKNALAIAKTRVYFNDDMPRFPFKCKLSMVDYKVKALPLEKQRVMVVLNSIVLCLVENIPHSGQKGRGRECGRGRGIFLGYFARF